MVLPGISGAHILIVVNKYQFILQQLQDVRYFEMDAALNILYFMLGAFIGIVSFVRILLVLIKKFKLQIIYFLVGLLIASLSIIWPYQHRVYIPFVKKEIIVQPNDDKLKQAVTILPDTPPCISLYHIKPNQENAQKQITLQQVEYKLTESYLYLPFTSNGNDNITNQWIGLLNVFVGIAIILVLSRVKNENLPI